MGEPKLVFDRYGGRHIPAGIVTEDGSYDLPQSKTEQRLISHAALRMPSHAAVRIEVAAADVSNNPPELLETYNHRLLIRSSQPGPRLVCASQSVSNLSRAFLF